MKEIHHKQFFRIRLGSALKNMLYILFCYQNTLLNEQEFINT